MTAGGDDDKLFATGPQAVGHRHRLATRRQSAFPQLSTGLDIETGAELWKGRLPAGGQATPMTYRLRPDGKQFVVIAAGGHGKLGTKLGDSVVAFTLP